MPNVTVNAATGNNAENVVAATVGTKRWGLNGTVAFGQSTQVPAGQNVDVWVYYSKNGGTSYNVKKNINADVTFNITASAAQTTVTP